MSEVHLLTLDSYEGGRVLGVGTLEQCKAAGETRFAAVLAHEYERAKKRPHRYPQVETLKWLTPLPHAVLDGRVMSAQMPSDTEWLTITRRELGAFEPFWDC